MQITQLIPSFNSGELSPFIHLRSDLEKYRSGCRLLENMMITPYGGVRRRPGFQFMAEAKYGDRPCRLLRFQYSVDENYIIEMGHNYMRFFTVDGPVMDGGVPYEVATPWSDSDLLQIQVAQINAVAYMVHKDYPPQKLTLQSGANWTLAEVDYEYPALRDENSNEDHTMTASAVEGEDVVLDSSIDFFTPQHVGSHFQIKHKRDPDGYETKADIRSNTTSDPLEVQGGWEFTTGGVWDATVAIQKSEDNGVTWEDERVYVGYYDRNASSSSEEDELVLYRIEVRDYNNHEGNGATARIESVNAHVHGLVKVVEYVSPTQVKVDVVSRLKATDATDLWSEGAWSDHRGHPRSVCFHQGRIVYGGNEAESQRIWGSMTDAYENFTRSSNDDGSFAHDLASGEQNMIQWMTTQKDLMIGTSGAEWILSTQKDSEPLSPTNVSVRRQSAFGSEYLQGQVINDVMLFVQRGGRKVRELIYSIESDGYVAPDLTMLAEHITDGGIVQTSFQQKRDAILWCITGNGKLIGLTYERSQNVVGWHRHTTSGMFESVATVSGAGEDDIMWVSVQRTVNGESKRYIEMMPNNQFQAQIDEESQPDLMFVDSAVKQEVAQATEVTGLDHLEGEEVQILADGAVLPARTVTGGKITFDEPQDPDGVDVAIVGLGYASYLQPMGIELGIDNGTSVGRNKRIHEVAIYFYRSSGCEVSVSKDGNYDRISFRDSGDRFDEVPGLFTGVKSHSLDAGHNYDASFVLKQTLPLPMTILAVVPKFNIYGDKV